MIYAQDTKHYTILKPQALATDAAVTGTCDTLGYNYATITFLLDTAATNATITTMKIGEANSGTSYTDVTAFVGGGAGGFTIPTPDGTSSTGNVVKCHIDLRGRKRYLQASLCASSATISTIYATLSRAKESPNTDAEAGCAEVVYG